LHKDAFQDWLKQRENDEHSQEEQLKELYLLGIARSQAAAALVEQAALVSPLKRETDYSYAAHQFAGPGFFPGGRCSLFS
jgi:hypothetical protein